MPGAFAHITAVNEASSNNILSGLNIPKTAKKALSQNKKFLELGCVSPDYPYLVIMDSAQNKWADEMHYNNVGNLICALIEQVKNLDEDDLGKGFAWLCGFVAHVAADITIHPVVEKKVGPYEQNAKEHRICEMHQDSYIWSKRMNLGNIGLADRVKENIGSCINDDTQLDSIIFSIWCAALSNVYPQYTEECQPDINAWHKGFQSVVDHAEESYRLFAWARHVATNQGLSYPLQEEVKLEYIEALDTPNGLMHYDDIFDKAIQTIQIFWEKVAASVYKDQSTDFFKNWNLDTGRCEDGQLTAWEVL
ncbi:zinc dependent phospholipase C family protein [Vibrio furnissii]|uniref:zinc dependent phospholipase C family protein n=1 Tax=Vibrio furnissii TaxID=29494 RepID=UPI0023DA7299|nr:zinc dependent phospholipase C family protein [Vibrio furnissii]